MKLSDLVREGQRGKKPVPFKMPPAPRSTGKPKHDPREPDDAKVNKKFKGPTKLGSAILAIKRVLSKLDGRYGRDQHAPRFDKPHKCIESGFRHRDLPKEPEDYARNEKFYDKIVADTIKNYTKDFKNLIKGAAYKKYIGNYIRKMEIGPSEKGWFRVTVMLQYERTR